MSTGAPQPLNEAKLHDFVMKAVGEMGAAMNAALVLIGDKLGLYKAMAGAGPMTSAELAAKTGTTERYVREWLAAQAAGGLVTYDAGTQKYTLPPEQAFALADEMSPVFLPGAYYIISACLERRGQNHRGLPQRQWRRLARTRFMPFHRHRAFLPAQLSRPLDRGVDSCPGRASRPS